MAVLWMVPLVAALFVSFRPYHDTLLQGYLSPPEELNLDNYRQAWQRGGLGRTYWNTALILAPALTLTLFASSTVAFVCSRFSWRFNTGFLVLFTAGGLLPQQILVQPLIVMYRRVPLPHLLSNSEALIGSTWGIILIHVAYQSGFCTFLLSNYMKTLPAELTDAAIIDGASLWQQYRQVIMPLCRPALAALATLEFTWIYNDFFWALVLEQQSADRPVTSSLASLSGGFFSDNNVVTAASVYVALPPILVFIALQRHFVSGLAVGSTTR